jgi:chromosome segregation ATPase
LSAQVGLASRRAQTNDITSRSSGVTEQLKSSQGEIVELTRVYNADIACRTTEQTARDKEVNGRLRDYEKAINNQNTVLNKQQEKIAQQEQDKASQQAEHSEQIAASRLRHNKAIQSCRNAYTALQIIYNKKYSTHQEKISAQAAEHKQVVKGLEDNYNRVKGYLEAANKKADNLQAELDIANREWEDCSSLLVDDFFKANKAQSELQDATSAFDRLQGELIDAEDQTQRLHTQLLQRNSELAGARGDRDRIQQASALATTEGARLERELFDTRASVVRLQDALQEGTASYSRIRDLMTEATVEYDCTQGGLMGSRKSCGKTSMTLCAGCTVTRQAKPHGVTLPALVLILVLVVMTIRVGYCRTHGVVVRTYSRHVPCS